MRLQKAFQGIIFAAFFLLCSQTVAFFAQLHKETVCNEGIAFGISFPLAFLLLLTGIAGGFLVKEWYGAKRFSEEWPLLLIVSGGASNMIDRFVYGCVVDYIYVPSFPVFNLADILLTAGVFGVIFIKGKNQIEKRKDTDGDISN